MSRNKQVNQVKDPFLSSCWKGIRSLRRASAIYQLYNQTIPNLILEKRTFQTIQLPWHRQKSVSVPNRTYSVHRVLRPRGTDRKFSSFDFEAAARYCQLFNVHIVPLWISRETVVDYCIRSGAVMSICIMHRLNKRVAVPSNVVEHGNRGSARRKTTIDSQILHTVHVHISSSIVQHIQINAPSPFFSFLSTLPRQPVIVHARLDHELRINASQRLWGRRQRHYEWLTPVAGCLYALIGTLIATIAPDSGYVLTDYVIFVAINSGGWQPSTRLSTRWTATRRSTEF